MFFSHDVSVHFHREITGCLIWIGKFSSLTPVSVCLTLGGRSGGLPLRGGRA